MPLDYTTLELLRQSHPAWRLLCARHAPLVAGFLHRVFIVPNVRNLSQADLVEALEDELFVLREQLGAEAFPWGGKWLKHRIGRTDDETPQKRFACQTTGRTPILR
nr:DUF3375 family protein [Geothermobacter hydrogeniphilus]